MEITALPTTFYKFHIIPELLFTDREKTILKYMEVQKDHKSSSKQK